MTICPLTQRVKEKYGILNNYIIVVEFEDIKIECNFQKNYRLYDCNL